MANNPVSVLIAADFNAANFAGYLANDPVPMTVLPQQIAYGQVAQALFAASGTQPSEAQAAVVWTRPETAVPAFGRLLGGEDVSWQQLLREVDDFIALLGQAEGRFATLFVPTWVIPPGQQAFSLINSAPLGVHHALLEMNLRLVDRLSRIKGFYTLQTSDWLAASSRANFNPKLWFLSKVPFGNDVFRAAAVAVKSALRGLAGKSSKLLILDLDNTLWGGTVGDVGLEHLRLGGHDPVGEAFVDFQRALLVLANRGALLAVVSKNDEKVALDAIERHPEMILRKHNLAGWRINWQDKAQNILDLTAELSLGLEAVVFIDDNPVERARVREALPEVVVPEWPVDKMLYTQALLELPWFNAPRLTEEDKRRTELYVKQRDRMEQRSRFESIDDWLSSLNTVVCCKPLDGVNLARATQLLNKTNQLNLATRRLSEVEFMTWSQKAEHSVWVFRVSDKFGDSGITALASLELNGASAQVRDFVLSCRVMGRKVEETVVAVLVAWASQCGAHTLRAQYLATSKNRPCLEFWMRSGFDCDETAEAFSWPLSKPYPVPKQVTLKYQGLDADPPTLAMTASQAADDHRVNHRLKHWT